jgi:hypothetical protein
MWENWRETTIPTTFRSAIVFPSIHSSNFLNKLFELINKLLTDSSTQPNPNFNFIIEAILPTIKVRTTLSQGFTFSNLIVPFFESVSL